MIKISQKILEKKDIGLGLNKCPFWFKCCHSSSKFEKKILISWYYVQRRYLRGGIEFF